MGIALFEIWADFLTVIVEIREREFMTVSISPRIGCRALCIILLYRFVGVHEYTFRYVVLTFKEFRNNAHVRAYI